jgi:hypothetical protein
MDVDICEWLSIRYVWFIYIIASFFMQKVVCFGHFVIDYNLF